MSFRQIHPLLSAALETRHIPARILVGFSRQTAELNVKGRLIRMYCHREMHLQQSLVFLPVHMGDKVNSAAVCVEDHFLAERGVGRFPVDLKHGAHRPHLRPFHAFHLIYIPELLGIIDVNIPVVKVDRFILVHPQQIGLFAGLYDLPVIFLVVDARKHPLLIKPYRIKRRFQLSVSIQDKGSDLFPGFGRPERAVPLGGQIFHKSDASRLRPLHRIHIALLILKGVSLKCTEFYHILTQAANRIEDGNRLSLTCDGASALPAHLCKLLCKLCVLLLRHLVHFMDGGSRQDIMELV